MLFLSSSWISYSEISYHSLICITIEATIAIPTLNFSGKLDYVWSSSPSRISDWTAGSITFLRDGTYRRINGFGDQATNKGQRPVL